MNRIVDTTFGMNHQAIAVMHYLAGLEPSFAEYNDQLHEYEVHFDTYTWHNGREQGFCVSMNPNGYAHGHIIHIAIYQHRNTDMLCALLWETKTPYWNHPLEDSDLFNKAYKGTKSSDYEASFDYGEIGKCADWIMTRLEEYYKLHHVYKSGESNAE